MSPSPTPSRAGSRPASKIAAVLLVLVFAVLVIANRSSLLLFPDEAFAPPVPVTGQPVTDAEAALTVDADAPWQVARERQAEKPQVAQMLRYAGHRRPPRPERIPGYAVALPFYRQGCALDQQGHFAEALQDYGTAVAYAPQWEQPYADMGWDWKKESRLDLAVQAERTAVRLDPSDANAYYGVGDMLLEQHRFEASVPFYRMCVHLDSSYWMGQRRLNAVFDLQHRWRDALAAGHAWSRLRPHDAEAHESLGDALVALGRKAEARAQWRRVLQMNAASDSAGEARQMLAKYP